jgi:hypothetical protein
LISVNTSEFPHALRSAIRDSGLSLNRIQYRLRERGHAVSSATLSYWQSGRSRPTRRESVLVVRSLEEVLRVPAGTLTALLEPPGARRGPGPRTGTEELSRISVHDRYEVGADRRVRRIRHRQVLRAERDGPDRWAFVYREDALANPLPEVRAVWHCRLGPVVVRNAPRLLVAELLFDRVLARGDTVVMEYELAYPGPDAPARARYERTFRFPVREHVMEVVFDPAAVPARCELYVADTARPLVIEKSGYVHAVGLDVPPCRRGIRWYWE